MYIPTLASLARQRQHQQEIEDVIRQMEVTLQSSLQYVCERNKRLRNLREERDFYFEKLRSIEVCCEMSTRIYPFVYCKMRFFCIVGMQTTFRKTLLHLAIVLVLTGLNILFAIFRSLFVFLMCS